MTAAYPSTSCISGCLAQLIVSIVLLNQLQHPAAYDVRCGSLEVQPCNISHSGFVREGFQCKTTGGTNCLDRHSWCSVNRDYVSGVSCTNSENLMFDRCLSVDKTINGVRYHLNIAKVHWTVAEQYCQSRDMHLVSFEDQQQYDAIIQFVRTVSQRPRDIVTTKDLQYSDKLAQRCWAIRGGSSSINIYWTGLFYDRHSRTWNLTDGTEVSDNINAIEAGSVALRDVFDRHSVGRHSGYIGLIDHNIDFFSAEVGGGHKRIDNINNRAGILCSAGDNRKWNGGISKYSSGCLTGFKCAGRETKCITGSMFENSDVCDGNIDCPRGDDEDQKYCQTYSATFPDGQRNVLFFPIRRSVATTKHLCIRRNLTLPSIHSKADIQFLGSLPQSFAKTRTAPDFLLNLEDWSNLDWKLLIGARRESIQWEDGSPIGYFEKDMSRLPSNSDVYLIFNATVQGKLEALHEQSHDIFPVCQERGYQVIAVPAIVTVQQNLAVKPANGVLMSFVWLCALYLRIP